MRAVWNKFWQYSHFRHFGRDKCAIWVNRIVLCYDHAFDDFLIIECLRTTWFAALKQPIVSYYNKFGQESRAASPAFFPSRA